MRSPKPIIATFLLAADARARIATGARGAFELIHFDHISGLLAGCAADDVVLVVLDATDRQGVSHASLVASIHASFETLPILVYCAPADAGGTIPGLVRAGATDIVLHGVDDSAIALRNVFRAGRRGSLRREIYDELAPLLNPEVTPLLRYALECSHDAPSVTAAAVSLGVDRKTLRNWLSRASVLSPRQLINSARLCLAVGMLADRRQTSEHIALELGFASGAAFRNMLRRYTGRPASDFRGRDGLASILELVKGRLISSLPDRPADGVRAALIRVISP